MRRPPIGSASDWSGKLIGVIVAICVVLLLACLELYRHGQQTARAAARQELAAIAELKVGQIASWRQERMSDGGFLSRAPGVAADLRRLLTDANSSEAAAAVGDWLELLKGGDRYEALVVCDRDLAVRQSLPAGVNLQPEILRPMAARATATGEVVMGELVDGGGTSGPRLHLLAPCYRDPEARAEGPLGFVVIRIDPTRSLFPLVESWPTPSPTAETLLVRREGTDVVYLTPLRHSAEQPLTLRRPLGEASLPAARVLRGETEVQEGVDYRGVPVVSVGRAIPGTGWAIVAKVDKSELYDVSGLQTVVMMLLGISLVLAGMHGANLIWRQRSSRLTAQLEVQAAALWAATEGIVITRADGTIEWINPGFTQLTGYSAADVIGRTPALLRSGRHDREFYRAMWEQILSGRPWHGELLNRRKDGSLYHEEMTITPVAGDSGRPTRFVAIKQDVTPRKQAEQMQTRMREELEQLVADRTAALRENIEALEHFSYAITHDMRAPLRAMNAYATLLQRQYGKQLPPEGLDLLERIRRASARLDHLIRDSLDYSKTMRASFPLRPIDLGPLLRGLLESYPDLQSPGAQIVIEFSTLWVMGNEAGLTQCFSNLLGNAVKFVAPGVVPRVRVSGGERTNEAGHTVVRVTVRDNGIGIPAESQRTIFQLSHRLHGPEEYPGTGVGLALVQKVVQRMAGSVGLSSAPGEGSVFWIELGKP